MSTRLGGGVDYSAFFAECGKRICIDSGLDLFRFLKLFEPVSE